MMASVLIRLLRTHLRPYRWLIVIVLLLQIVQASANLLLPGINRNIIDNGVAKGDTGYIWSHGTLMLVTSVVALVFTVAAVWVGSRIANSFGRDVRAALFHKVTGFSQREVNTFGASSLITRVTNDVSQVQMLLQMTTTTMLAAPITAVVGVVMALREDVELTLVVAVAIPVLVGSIGLMIWRMIPAFHTMQDRIDSINKVLREQITGIRVVRAFVRDDFESTRYRLANEKITRVSVKVGSIFVLMFPVIMMVRSA